MSSVLFLLSFCELVKPDPASSVTPLPPLHLKTETAQIIKYGLSQQIQREVFFLSFVPGAKNIKNILIKLMLLYQVSLNKGIFNSL